MNRNMGTVDRIVRAFLVAPVAFVSALALGAGSIAGIVLLVVTGIMVATAAVGFCPLYALLRIDTRGRRTLAHG